MHDCKPERVLRLPMITSAHTPANGHACLGVLLAALQALLQLHTASLPCCTDPALRTPLGMQLEAAASASSSRGTSEATNEAADRQPSAGIPSSEPEQSGAELAGTHPRLAALSAKLPSDKFNAAEPWKDGAAAGLQTQVGPMPSVCAHLLPLSACLCDLLPLLCSSFALCQPQCGLQVSNERDLKAHKVSVDAFPPPKANSFAPSVASDADSTTAVASLSEQPDLADFPVAPVRAGGLLCICLCMAAGMSHGNMSWDAVQIVCIKEHDGQVGVVTGAMLELAFSCLLEPAPSSCSSPVHCMSIHQGYVRTAAPP